MLAIMNRPLYLYEEKIISSEIPALIDSESFLKTALNSKHVHAFLLFSCGKIEEGTSLGSGHIYRLPRLPRSKLPREDFFASVTLTKLVFTYTLCHKEC